MVSPRPVKPMNTARRAVAKRNVALQPQRGVESELGDSGVRRPGRQMRTVSRNGAPSYRTTPSFRAHRGGQPKTRNWPGHVAASIGDREPSTVWSTAKSIGSVISNGARSCLRAAASPTTAPVGVNQVEKERAPQQQRNLECHGAIDLSGCRFAVRSLVRAAAAPRRPSRAPLLDTNEPCAIVGCQAVPPGKRGRVPGSAVPHRRWRLYV